MIDSTNSIPLYVVDASVAAKWFLPDEPDVTAAVTVLADFRAGRTALVTPGHLRYEVPSAIRAGYRTKRLTLEGSRAAISRFLSLQVPTIDDASMIEAGYEHSLRFGCSLYDGVYLALAESLDCPFVFADRRLRNGLGEEFPRALWLTDYVPAV